MKPLIVKAFGRKLDEAVLFGQNRPASWSSPAMVADAIAVDNVVAATTEDPAADLLLAAEKITSAGFVPSGAVVRPGWQYAAAARRTAELVANPVGDGARPYALSIGGLPVGVDPLAWDRTVAEAIVADWGCVVVAIRSDIKFEIFNSGVISDEDGKVLVNLMQQDTSAIRATFRVGAMLAKPVSDYGDGGSPVAIVTPGSASS